MNCCLGWYAISSDESWREALCHQIVTQALRTPEARNFLFSTCGREFAVARPAALRDSALGFGGLALEHHAELRAHAGFAFDPHAAAHGFHHVLHDRKPEPRAPDLARTPGIDTIETFEQARQVTRFDARPVVFHE